MNQHTQNIIEILQKVSHELKLMDDDFTIKLQALAQSKDQVLHNTEQHTQRLEQELLQVKNQLASTTQELIQARQELQEHSHDIVYLDEQTRWKNGRPKKIPETEYSKIVMYYQTQHLPISKIAEYYDVSYSTIRRILKKALMTC